MIYFAQFQYYIDIHGKDKKNFLYQFNYHPTHKETHTLLHKDMNWSIEIGQHKGTLISCYYTIDINGKRNNYSPLNEPKPTVKYMKII